MNCKTARSLIATRVDAASGDEESRELRLHLQHCARCRAYAEEQERLIVELQSDAARMSSSRPSPAFASRLTEALLASEQARRPRWVGPLPIRMPALRVPFPTAVSRALISAAAAAAAALWLTTAVLTQPPQSGPDVTFGHIGCLEAHSSSDGRVYTALVQHRAVGRLSQQEVYLR